MISMSQQSNEQDDITGYYSKKGAVVMKKYVGIILCIFLLPLCACKSNSNEVVFLNWIPGNDREPVSLPYNVIKWSYKTNQPKDTLYAVFLVHEMCEEDKEYIELLHSFEWDENASDEVNAEGAKAHLLKEYDYETKAAIEMIKDTNLILLEDYPYCFYNHSQENLVLNGPSEDLILGHCAVVGTYEEIQKVFYGTNSVNGHYFRVYAAPRPDLLEKAKEVGYKGNLEDGWLGDWMLNNKESIKSVIGEENQITMKVKFDTVEE